MAVGADYLLAKPPRPSPARRAVDQHLIPAAVNLAGAMETALDRAVQRTGVPARVILAAMLGVLVVPMVARAVRRRAGR